MRMRTTLMAIALLCLALAVPANAQTYAEISAEWRGAWTAGSVLELTLWVELDDRGGADAGLAGMDMLLSWNPAKVTLSNISQGELWIGGVYTVDDDIDLDSDGDWLDSYYTSDPPGPGVQHKILNTSTDTYLGEIPGSDGVAGTNLWPNKFEVTPGASSVFLQGYQDTPADFSIGVGRQRVPVRAPGVDSPGGPPVEWDVPARGD